MKKVAVLFHDGFEELEALSVVDIMRRANVECTMVGMDKEVVTSSHQIKISMDCVYDNNLDDYDMIVIPGGLPGATNLRDDNRVIELVKDLMKIINSLVLSVLDQLYYKKLMLSQIRQ
ncbi:DJ-1/PfpI family protein [Coprobacillaceae bacterium CR2/5/TPMF4]|nr:DJ-1/PfpI family protein [Coprobacillaceae bacterium CR2/5/TPMF4]